MKIWQGLECLSRVEKELILGTYYHPTHPYGKTPNKETEYRLKTAEETNRVLSEQSWNSVTNAIVLELDEARKGYPLLKLDNLLPSLTPKRTQTVVTGSIDWDSLSNIVKGVKL